MAYLETLLERNREFAAQQSAAGTLVPSLATATATVKAFVIGCVDMRVDPADILGLEPGEALVLRNVGGRIVPSLLEQMGLLGRIGEVVQKKPGGGGEFHLVVMQHTDCGITRLTNDPAKLAHFFGIAESALPGKSVSDPRAAVAADVASLRAVPTLPGSWILSGLVYDVATGKIEVVIPPAPIRPSDL
jgi:carbonic anhydrase